MSEEFEIPAGMIFTDPTQPSAPEVQQTSETPEVETPEIAPVAEPEIETPEPSEEVHVEEPAKEKVPDANASALEALREKIRADDAEAKIKALTPAEKPLGEKPNIADFDALENYENALIEWAKGVGKQEANSVTTAQQEEKANQEIRAKVLQRANQVRAKNPDFDSVVAPLARVLDGIPVVNAFMQESDNGMEMAYHLAKNPAMLQELKSMSTIAAGRKLFELEARIKAAPVVKQSSAPNPIKPVGSRETVKPQMVDLATKNPTAYIEQRNKEELARLRAH